MSKSNYKLGVVILIISYFLIFFSVTTYASPANNTLKDLLQPSGEKIQAYLEGDEHFHWMELMSGEVIAQDSSGYWCYAQINSNELQPGTNKCGIDKTPANTIKRANLSEISTNVKNYNKQLSAINHDIIKRGPNSNEKLLIILMSFQDMKIKSSIQSIYNHYFGVGTNSVNDYYQEVSGDNFKFTPAEENNNLINDGIIQVDLNYNHPNTASDVSINADITAARDALNKAAQYINFQTFDVNNDGYISTNELHIVFMFSGYTYESSSGYASPSLWSHQTTLSGSLIAGGMKFLDGAHGGGGVFVGEITKFSDGDEYATLGTSCHELGHDLGLPDLYDYTYQSEGVGVYSLMGSGNYGYKGNAHLLTCPVHLDAWSKVQLGFFTPIVVTSPQEYHLIASSLQGYNIIQVNTSKPGEYFLIENREFNGFDASLGSFCKAGGVAIWHIDQNLINLDLSEGLGINNSYLHKGVDLEESNESVIGYPQLDRQSSYLPNKSLDNLYYVGNNWLFSPSTVPNSSLYNGIQSNASIKVMDNSSNDMTVKIFWGTEPVDPVGTLGDVNSDGNIDLDDAISILRYSVGVLELDSNQIKLGDVNHDNKVDLSDAIMILQYYVGLIKQIQ